MMKYEVSLEGTVTVEAKDEILAEDLAMDLIHGDISAWADNTAEIEFNVTEVSEID